MIILKNQTCSISSLFTLNQIIFTNFIFSRSSPICLSLIAVYENTFCSSIFLSNIYAKITWKAIAIPVCSRYFLNISACFFLRLDSSSSFNNNISYFFLLFLLFIGFLFLNRFFRLFLLFRRFGDFLFFRFLLFRFLFFWLLLLWLLLFWWHLSIKLLNISSGEVMFFLFGK